MSKITTLLQKMKSLCDNNNGKDTFNSPVTNEEISTWETEHNIKLCDELKDFYLFSNGMDLCICFSTFSICPFDKITFREGGLFGYGEFEGYMEIGDFVGDGSVICINRNYDVCCIFEGDAEITEYSLTELIERELEHLEEEIEYRKWKEQNN
ncbi:MAG: SMI1/KNR4 family protein [Ruminococcus sp.]|nr:SMI1/KNR4 family protein [Ruminococcus sp.]